MALHTQGTDPDDDPSPNPHVHLCVKATALDGNRLNPRKADLQRWREAFAQRLREHGVACEATPRIQRLQPKRGEKQSVRHKKARGERLDRIGAQTSDPQRVERAKGKETHVIEAYRVLAQTLALSETAADRRLAMEVASRVAEMSKGTARDRDNLRDR
jgi:hypothetical protein